MGRIDSSHGHPQADARAGRYRAWNKFRQCCCSASAVRFNTVPLPCFRHSLALLLPTLMRPESGIPLVYSWSTRRTAQRGVYGRLTGLVEGNQKVIRR